MPNPSTADWHKIEAALERVTRHDFGLDRDSESGDLVAEVNHTLNLTELAKALAEELAS